MSNIHNLKTSSSTTNWPPYRFFI